MPEPQTGALGNFQTMLANGQLAAGLPYQAGLPPVIQPLGSQPVVLQPQQLYGGNQQQQQLYGNQQQLLYGNQQQQLYGNQPQLLTLSGQQQPRMVRYRLYRRF